MSVCDVVKVDGTVRSHQPDLLDGASGFMRQALDLAKKGAGTTSPNPMVGAVVTNNGRAVGCGYHRRAGGPHAEVIAIEDAGETARGAEMYVTLEPCCHHGRTPPCADRVIAAGVKRVICAMEDPNPLVSGEGLERLVAAGVEVEVGVCETETRRLNEAWLWWIATGRPFVTLKWAQTLDGRIATRSGESAWISSEISRARAHRLRAENDAVLVGSGTVRADDPSLDVRLVDGPNPIKVVLDTNLRIDLNAKLLDGDNVILMCGETVPLDAVDRWSGRQDVEVVNVETEHGRVDPASVLTALGERDVVSLLVEGGHEVATNLLNAGLVNRVTTFISPKLMGHGIDAVGDLGTNAMGELLELSDVDIETLGDEVMISGVLKNASDLAAEAI